MMRTIGQVYTTKACKYRLADIKQAMYQHRDIEHAWLIVFDTVHKRLEIMKIDQMFHPYFDEDQYILAGVAENRTKATELLMEMIEDAEAREGTSDIARVIAEDVSKGTAEAQS